MKRHRQTDRQTDRREGQMDSVPFELVCYRHGDTLTQTDRQIDRRSVAKADDA